MNTKTLERSDRTSKSIKLDKDGEIIRLAFLYAEQDRLSFADCHPRGSSYRSEAFKLAAEFRKQRLKLEKGE